VRRWLSTDARWRKGITLASIGEKPCAGGENLMGGNKNGYGGKRLKKDFFFFFF
jgi:hypothetical protein